MKPLTINHTTSFLWLWGFVELSRYYPKCFQHSRRVWMLCWFYLARTLVMLDWRGIFKVQTSLIVVTIKSGKPKTWHPFLFNKAGTQASRLCVWRRLAAPDAQGMLWFFSCNYCVLVSFPSHGRKMVQARCFQQNCHRCFLRDFSDRIWAHYKMLASVFTGD